MGGNIYINGLIGSDYNEQGELIEKGVELVDVIMQVKNQPKAESFKVYINSVGGVVDTGFEIYDYLRSLGKPIHTIGQGLVASIATVIFMAGDKRELRPSTEFFVHLPSGGILGNSDEINEYAGIMKAVEKRIVKFYNDTAGLSESEILPLMKAETSLSTEEALRLGFANVKAVAVAPVALINNKSKKKMATKKEKTFMEQVRALLNGKPATNKIVFDAENTEIDFYELGEDDTIEVGAKANIDGQPAEGSVVIASGETYVFVAGELTEIVEVEVEEEMDAEALAAENEALKTQIEELTAKLETTETAKAEIEAENTKNVEIINKIKALQSEVKVTENKEKPAAKKEVKKSLFADAVSNLKPKQQS